MFKSLFWKLSLAFLLVALVSAVLVTVSFRLSSTEHLNKLVSDEMIDDFKSLLTNYYVNNGSWEGIATYWAELRYYSTPSPSQPPEPAPEFNFQRFSRDRRGLFGLADANGAVLIPLKPDYPTGSNISSKENKENIPLEVNGKKVGALLVAPSFPPPPFTTQQNQYLQRTTQALITAMLLAILIALIVGFVLALTLVRPLKELTIASQQIAGGNFEQQVKISSKDEIGQLADAFNQMSKQVALANRLRKQMTADTAHELRTPLTVIAGYIESMQDGVLKPTKERLALIYQQIEQLLKLVGDLRMISQVDAGELPLHPQKIAPQELLERAITPYQHLAEKKGIRVRVDASHDLPVIQVDEARMMQVFGNLLINALRYTPSSGEVRLSAQVNDHQVCFSVQDTGCGIAEEDLPFVFNRFYRGDQSRQTDSGETGLGLAIAKSLVEAHQGRMSVTSEQQQGTTFFIYLPIEKT